MKTANTGRDEIIICRWYAARKPKKVSKTLLKLIRDFSQSLDKRCIKNQFVCFFYSSSKLKF